MARGRMLNKSISASLKLQNLPDDTCRLMATWIIGHLDKNGVFYGDPMMVKSFIFPRRGDITLEQVEMYLEKMQEVALIELFEINGQLWQYWVGFQDNQIGLRPERESTSFPLPPNSGNDDGNLPDTPDEIPPTDDGLFEPELIQQIDGRLPENSPPNRSEVNRSEIEDKVKENPPRARTDDEIPKSEFELIQDAILDVCKIEITRQNQGTLLSVVRTMQNKARAPTDIMAFGKWWMEYDFRGQKGSCPAVSQISSEWPKFEDFKRNGASPNGRNSKTYQRGQSKYKVSDPNTIRADIERAKAARS